MINRVFQDRMMQGLVIAGTVIVAIGSVYYSLVEGWSLLDSVYFCVVASTTVGLGDVAPVTAAGKLFTIFYLLSSVGIFAMAGITFVERSRIWARLEEQEHERSRRP